jgi:hypothetical protein
MLLSRLPALIIVPFLVSATPHSAAAQVPPHTPGTVCLTPTTWCWANTPGAPGKPCVCLTSGGYVQGILG